MNINDISTALIPTALIAFTVRETIALLSLQGWQMVPMRWLALSSSGGGQNLQGCCDSDSGQLRRSYVLQWHGCDAQHKFRWEERRHSQLR